VRTPEQGGTTCVGVRGFAGALATAKGVSGWRFKTPSGRTGDGRYEVTIEGYCEAKTRSSLVREYYSNDKGVT